ATLTRARPGRDSSRATRVRRRLTRVDLLDELLLAPDRDHCPGAAPVISVSGREDAAFARALRAARRERCELSRRGAWHGEFAVLDPARAAGPAPAPEVFAGRWLAARPIVLPGIARALVEEEKDEIAWAGRLHPELAEKGRLRRLVEERL